MHFTLIIVFFLIAWMLAASLMPQTHPGLTRVDYWIMGILGAAILFISVLLHELAHSTVSLRYGLKVRQIMLFIFGGVSDIEEDEKISKDFHKEFKIAVVGPITSFVIAGIFGISWLTLSNIHTSIPSAATPMITVNEIKSIAEGILQYGTFVNVLLGGFNLIPAFPLDGGRILRSALLRWRRDYDQSTKTAVRIGIAVSYGFMAVGFMTMLSGSFIGGMWILLIGWFLNSGAQSYLSQHELSSVLSHVRLREIMNTNIISVKPDITVNELLDSYFNVYRKTEFPVVEEHGDLIGAATTKEAMNVQKSSKDTIKVEEIMIPKDELIVMKSNALADEALKRITRENKSRIFVYEEDRERIPAGGREEERLEVKEQERRRQKLVGLISKTDTLNIAREREEFEKAVEKLGY